MDLQTIERVKTRVERARLELDCATAHRLQLERQLGSDRPRRSVQETYEETQEPAVARFPNDEDLQQLALQETYQEALRLESAFHERYRKALSTYSLLQLHGNGIERATN